MTKKLQFILIFLAGAGAGALIFAGIFQTLMHDSIHIGGESFIPLLLVLFIYFGWSLGTEWHKYNLNYEKAKAYRSGYVDGIKKVNDVIQHDQLAMQMQQPIRRENY
jgi:hypothetical protein